MEKKDKFTTRLTKILNEKNMNRTKLCELTGINKGTISKYYNNQLTPKIETVETIANVLNVSPMWLMGYDVPMYTQSNSELYIEKIIMKLKTLDEYDCRRIYEMIDIMIPPSTPTKHESNQYEENEEVCD